jgi:photosystem II stability/assembly factor-like uncharacterized protein
VEDRIVSQRRGKSDSPRFSARKWQEVVAAACVVLIVGLLAYVLNAARMQRAGPAPVSRATATTSAITPTLTSSVIIPGPQLAWRQASAPPGIDVAVASDALATLKVAPSDGDVAYLCVAPTILDGLAQGSNAHIYITHDRGQTWERGGDIQVGAQPQSDGKPFLLECHTILDATRPDRAVVETEWLQAGEDGDISRISSFASFDYGSHWRKLIYPSPFAVGPKIASYSSNIYGSGAAENPGGDQGLWVSRDQMRTWQALTLPGNTSASDFWLNPITGALLVAANSTLFSSVDGGATWVQLPARSSAGILWLVQPPRGSAPWQICGALQANTLTCSGDAGQTWAARPALNLAQDSPKGFEYVAPVSFFALASDGAVLAGVTADQRPAHLYRLPAGASVWQDVGPMQTYYDSGPTYAPTSTSGALWLRSSQVFTAAYPPA